MQKRTSKYSATLRGREGSSNVLGPRELNRATLERQMLLRRQKISALEALERLVGMQAQAPAPPYLGLWTRLEDFRPDELARLILERRAVRIALMRNSVHLVSASDCLALRPLMQPVFDRGLYSTRANRAHLEGLDIEVLIAAGRALLEEKPRTAKELGDLLQQRWPDRDPTTLARAIRHLIPLVQVPPRGLWRKSGPAAHTTAEAWLGSPLDTAPSLEQTVLRYLGAFGPATFLVDGFVRGTWKAERSRSKATLEIKPFEPLAREDRDALAEEGKRLICFTREGAEAFEIRFAEPWGIYRTSW